MADFRCCGGDELEALYNRYCYLQVILNEGGKSPVCGMDMTAVREDFDLLKKDVAEERALFLGAFRIGELVSMGNIHFSEPAFPRIGTIRGVVTIPKWRSRGLGRGVVTRLIYAARERGLDCCELTCDSGRIHARELYASFGFVELKIDKFCLPLCR